MGADLSFPADLGYTLPTVIGGIAANTAHDRARAVRAVAAHARDAAQCAELLAMLGLHAQEGLPEREATNQARSEPANEAH